MKSFISLRKSMISGTMAVALLSSSVPYNAALQSYAAETPDTGVTSEIARSIYEAPASENNIVFTAEDAAENAVAKKSSASTLSMAEENGYKYYVTAGRAVIDTYIGDETEIVIPDTLGGFEVTEIGYAAFAGNKNITSVKIRDSINRINHDAFNGCTSLTEVDIPSSVTSIQDGAFSGCTALVSITLPDSVSRIEDNTFAGCNSLSEVKLNSNIDYIGKSAFANCRSLSAFEIPASVTAIGNMAFAGSGLSSLDVPDTVTSLGYAVFANCASLKEIKLPESITVLKSGNDLGMFSNCTSLESVTFPVALAELGNNAFSGCTSLDAIALPETVNKIGSGAFRNCTLLTTFTVPSLVTRIEGSTFSECTSLESVKLHNNVEYLGGSAFSNCVELSEAVLPAKLAEIGEKCFYNCGIKEINVPKSVTEIGGGAFAACASLKKAVLPDTIKVLNSVNGLGLFSDDTSLTDVKLPSALTTIGALSFRNCKALEKINIPSTVTAINNSAFESCCALKSVVIPDGVTVISDRTFYDCPELASAVLPADIDEVRNYAFAGCSSLSDIGNKASFFKFAEYAFSGCSSLNDERATVFTSESPVMNVSSAAKIVGGVANFSIKYDLNDWICSGFANGENSDVRFELNLPSGLLLIDSSVVTDSEDNKATFVGNSGVISLTKPTGTLHFSARIEAYNAEAYTIRPRMHFNSHNYNWSQTLPDMALTVPKLTISAQSTVSKRSCDIYGIAEPGKKVKIYLGDELVGEAVSNQYTGKYVVTAVLPEEAENDIYNLHAVCGVEKTNDITVKYSNNKPSITSVELLYCTHAPTNINKYTDTLDITGIFTKGERPLIQYYPAGNMRFKITATNPDRISSIVVRSKKGNESKYLVAEYDEAEGAFMTPEGAYFDESNHNYVPGSLNLIIFDKRKPVVDDETVEALKNSIDLSKYDTESIKIDDTSCIARLKSKTTGKKLTDCYYYASDSVAVNGKSISADKLADSYKEYGFEKSDGKILMNGKYYTAYHKTISNKKAADDKTGFDNSVLAQADEAYTNSGKSSYSMDDYLAFAHLLISDDGSVPARVYIQADAEQPKAKKRAVIRDEAENDNMLYLNNIVRFNSDDDDDDPTEDAQNFLDTVAEYAFDDDSPLGPVYNAISGITTVARTNRDATERYDEIVSNTNTGSSYWDAEIERISALERDGQVMISGMSVATSSVDPGYYSSSLDYISNGLGTICDARRRQCEELAAIDVEMADYGWCEYDSDGQMNTIVDPSGIVYEGIKSKTVSGAVMTCYVLDEETGEWKVWNAEDYDQQNPIITDAAGAYAWDVPEGTYYVTCEVPGYDIIKSEIFNVAPPKFDLDFNLLNKTAPAVRNYILSENAVRVEFTKVMDIETVNNDTVSIGGISSAITVEPQLYAPDDKYSDTFVVSGDFSSTNVLGLSISGNAIDYTGTAMEEFFVRIQNIYADLKLNTESIEILADETFKLTANKDFVTYTSADPEIATVDENGLITAVSKGETKITAVDSVGKEAIVYVKVNVKIDEGEICQWAIRDYRDKTGKNPANAELTTSDDGKYVITLTDVKGNVLDVYTVDPITGIGTNMNDENINLPQTGDNSMTNWLTAFAAIMSTIMGLIAIKASGIIRRKEDEQ